MLVQVPTFDTWVDPATVSFVDARAADGESPHRLIAICDGVHRQFNFDTFEAAASAAAEFVTAINGT